MQDAQDALNMELDAREAELVTLRSELERALEEQGKLRVEVSIW